MRKGLTVFSVFSMLLLLNGCSFIGEKNASLCVIYAATAILSILLFIGYFIIAARKNLWFILLFSSISVVNAGYFALSVSRNLKEALLANSVSYLGSVLLPFSMMMIILNVTKISYRKWLPYLLSVISFIVFIIAASPGYSSIYYKEVFFEKIGGVTVLSKVYGPLHIIYFVYLIGYFSAMVFSIVYASVKKKLDAPSYAIILAIAVFVNIGVWFIEQLSKIDFELLSVSYIISGSFILGLQLFILENEKQKQKILSELAFEAAHKNDIKESISKEDETVINVFLQGVSILTPKELEIYNCYTKGMNTSEIMTKLNIKENTLKFHNKNIYSKLGVSSRKQLIEIHKKIRGSLN